MSLLLAAVASAAICAPRQTTLPTLAHAATHIVSPVLSRSALVASAARQVHVPHTLRAPDAVRASLRGGAAAAAEEEPKPTGMKAWLLKYRTFLLLACLILQKCVTDVLTNLTRRETTYSATSVALLSEVVKFPLLIVAVIVFGGGVKRIMPTVKGTVTNKPFSLTWVSLCYSIQNVLYFLALSHLSAESYQVLSQSKLLFTAFLMMGLLGTRLRANQWTALGMLLAGSLLVQLSEASRAVVAGGNAYLGGLWAILGSLLSSLPNVYYEKILKQKDTDEWVRNLQMTFWIFLWILVSMAFEGKGMALDLTGFSFNVWVIIALKSLNCLLIPATLKYADNILYSYAKPTSIVLTCALSSAVSGMLPAPRFLMGMVLVLGSMTLYNRKPSEPEKKTA